MTVARCLLLVMLAVVCVPIAVACGGDTPSSSSTNADETGSNAPDANSGTASGTGDHDDDASTGSHSGGETRASGRGDALDDAGDSVPFEPFQVRMEITTGDTLAVASVVYIGRYAVTTGAFIDDDELSEADPGAPAVVYDLDQEAWYDLPEGKRTTLREARTWAHDLRTRTRQSLDQAEGRAHPEMIRFQRMLLEPDFEVETTADGTTFFNDFVRYECRDGQHDLSDAQRRRLGMCETLTAYEKSMSNPRMGPFVQLVISKKLAEARLLPCTMHISMQIPGSGRIEYSIKLIIIPPPDDVVAHARKVAERVPGE